MSDLLVTDVVTGGRVGQRQVPKGKAQGSFAGSAGKGKLESFLIMEELAWPASGGGGEV